MDNSTKRMINSLAEDILNIYNIPVPIQDIGEIVEKLGGTIQREVSFSDGTVEKNGEGFRIILSPFQDEKRERFTIAHELGHLFLHMGYRTNEKLWERQSNNIYHRIGNSEKEYQANEFAAAFLMPADKYLEVLKDLAVDDMVDTSEIAEFFNVSVEAASNRGKFLGYLRW
ncbi:MAG: ImmA/IrrE family metallo-endopeptidase [Eubacteriales bacterium]|nr:ImmA/IrrE family metallo-endopeptidase [Eubacteriales bacterium]